MKRIAWLIILLCSVASAQNIDWTPCQKAMKPLQATVDKFNASRKDGLRMELYCVKGESQEERLHRKSEIHVPLTASEAKELNRLRAISDAAFRAQSEYEDTLYANHGVKKLGYGPCWHFIGIVVDQDYITIDPNPAFAGMECKP